MTRNEIAYLFSWASDEEIERTLRKYPIFRDPKSQGMKRHYEMVKLPKEVLLSGVGFCTPGGDMKDVEAALITASLQSKLGRFDAGAILAKELSLVRAARMDYLYTRCLASPLFETEMSEEVTSQSDVDIRNEISGSSIQDAWKQALDEIERDR